jgi:hypothetical protein
LPTERGGRWAARKELPTRASVAALVCGQAKIGREWVSLPDRDHDVDIVNGTLRNCIAHLG